VRFAARRAEVTQAAADAHPGRMAALIGASIDQAEAACAATPPQAWVANDNAPGQVVIAGTPDGLDAAVERAKEAGVRRAMPLAVGGAFHTPLMDGAAAAIADALVGIPLAAPAAPVVSNEDAQPHADGDGWRDRLPRHVTHPVRWRTSMETLAAMGADAFVEVGNGAMIAGVAKRTVPGIPVHACGTPEAAAAITSEVQR